MVTPAPGSARGDIPVAFTLVTLAFLARPSDFGMTAVPANSSLSRGVAAGAEAGRWTQCRLIGTPPPAAER